MKKVKMIYIIESESEVICLIGKSESEDDRYIIESESDVVCPLGEETSV